MRIVRKRRLDLTLVERGLAPGIERARAEIMGGNVLVDEVPCLDASRPIREEQQVRLRVHEPRYVSRGGLKLEAALDEFRVSAEGRTAIDLGASTGGFTDCLLQRGAARVYAVDVGYNQLAWKLRQDPRVVVLERTNARNLDRLPDLPGGGPAESATLLVGDLSFISLGLILPAIARLLSGPGAPGAPDRREAVLLIKPQFEVAADVIEAGGRLRNPEARAAAIERVLEDARGQGFEVIGVMESPVHGAKAGNVEALVHLRR